MMEEESQEENTEKIIKGTLGDKAWRWFKIMSIIIFGGGSITGGFMWEAIKDKVVEEFFIEITNDKVHMKKFVSVLDSMHHIKPFTPKVAFMIDNAELVKHIIDSALDYHGNYIAYQQQTNNIFLTSCTSDTIIDEYPMFWDSCLKIYWIVQDGFIYQAIPVGDEWIYYPFQWQLKKGDDNRAKVRKPINNG